MKNFFFALIAFCFVAGCDDDTFDFVGQLSDDKQIIRDYLKDNNLDADSLDSGLYYIIEEEGTGSSSPSSFSNVTVYYKGYFLDGSVFDQTGNDPVSLDLNQTVTGWQQGLPLIKKGGKIRLFVPSLLGYGEFGRGSVPGNTVIFFDVDLLNFR